MTVLKETNFVSSFPWLEKPKQVKGHQKELILATCSCKVFARASLSTVVQARKRLQYVPQ